MIEEFPVTKEMILKEVGVIEYEEEFDEYVAVTMADGLVFGTTRQGCYLNLREANRIYIEHCQKSREDKDGL